MASLEKTAKRTVKKFHSAFVGIKAGLLYDRSILVQVILAVITVVVFSFLSLNAVEWLFIVSAIFVVLITEFLNSAIEDVCDLLIQKYDLHVKEIKDIAAAAVLLAAIYAIVVALIILAGRIL
ncbi:diacylglycerol kinase family protein [Erysipelothrix sp. HDW6C]|uniref:diacylglycerol kinase n=1 Tax=Erysipelothrix sp. HDW6C TaxID=2714930 RepID=UPI00140DBBA9|nr:diacylglycerol kinase [Erysipelothrix sp. HDW6C]QIK70168.1 diacylglycerol kinase family protein [Erysipelothrix sp. HDW6C]